MTPTPVKTLRVIEATSRCNLACVYCIHPTMPRPKVDMTPEIWARVLLWLRYFRQKGTQTEVVFTGVGEPTLHPNLPAMLLDVRRALGPEHPILLSTNGKTATKALAEAMAPATPAVCVTSHFAHVAGPAAMLYHEAGLLARISTDPVTGPQDWAGQVPWPTIFRGPNRPTCGVLADAAAQVNADGTLAVCCMDGSHQTADGSIFDDPEETAFRMRPYALCDACWQQPPA
jgi:hypothetical protein